MKSKRLLEHCLLWKDVNNYRFLKHGIQTRFTVFEALSNCLVLRIRESFSMGMSRSTKFQNMDSDLEVFNHETCLGWLTSGKNRIKSEVEGRAF